MWDMCTNPWFLRLMFLAKGTINLIKVAAPIVLIITGMITYAKAIISKKEDLVKEANKRFVNQIMMACAIFLLPTIVTTYIIKDINGIQICYENMSLEKIQLLEEERRNLAEASKKTWEHKFPELVPGHTPGELGDEDLMLTFVGNWEHRGTPDECNADDYKSYNVHDGTVTIGYGVTNHLSDYAKSVNPDYGQYFPMNFGDCVPKKVVNDVMLSFINITKEQVVKVANELDVSLNDNQIIAIVDLGYNYPAGIRPAIQGYKSGGNEGYWNYIRQIIHMNGGVIAPGLIPRRDGEYELFQNGYTDNVALYYDRKLLYS